MLKDNNNLESTKNVFFLDKDRYEKMYTRSIENPEDFWREQGKCINWIKNYSKIKDINFQDDIKIRWFYDGTLNVCYNCVDRHLEKHSSQIAIIWQGDNPSESKQITYLELFEEVCKFANVLKSRGVKKGDVVTIYMPMIPEAIYAMLACARIGAIHSVVFGGFSPNSLKNRVKDCGSTCIITSDEGIRRGQHVPLKENVDKAISDISNIHTCIVVKRTGKKNINWNANRDIWYHEEILKVKSESPIVEMKAEDPLFILYTSGSTGKPKGVLHTSGGYLVYASMTHKYIFNYKKGDIYWCTADIGWITGHSYIVYGPLSNCATTLIFEGVPDYPDASRFWQICDKYKVNIFYTSPTAIRSLMREGDAILKHTNRDSLRLLGSVGEPINPEAWLWYYNLVGKKRCPIVDTWWQTETGGILLSPLPGVSDLKPGSVGFPFFGVKPNIIDDKGKKLTGTSQGNLCISDSWPGQMRTVYKSHKRFKETYFSTFQGQYFTGDNCKRDEDGYYWITGRVDDVINVSGHRLSTAEIESVLNSHALVVESAVVGYPHPIKGQGIFAFIILRKNIKPTEKIYQELVNIVRESISPIAKPNIIQWVTNLPKTRSGKIMRRILRKIAGGEVSELGDTSTLSDPSVVQKIVEERKKAID